MKCLLCKKQTAIIAKEVRDGKADVFYCEKCELGMLENVFAESELKEYYDKKYRKTTSLKLGSGMSPEELFNTGTEFQGNRISFLKKYFGRNKKLLDVGCSAGMFLWHAKKHVGEVVGLDHDSRSAKFAAQKCGCKTYSEDIEKTGLEEKYFDIISVFQTLEHTVNPHDFIAKHKKYLKPGGIMAIEVPNLRDPLLYLYDVSFYEKFFFHKSHLWYFTAKSLEKLMLRSGFKGKAAFLQEHNILNHMSWFYANAPEPNGSLILRKPVLPVRDNIKTEIKNALNGFIQSVDLAYKKKLGKLGAASTLFYIGKNG